MGFPVVRVDLGVARFVLGVEVSVDVVRCEVVSRALDLAQHPIRDQHRGLELEQEDGSYIFRSDFDISCSSSAVLVGSVGLRPLFFDAEFLFKVVFEAIDSPLTDKSSEMRSFSAAGYRRHAIRTLLRLIRLFAAKWTDPYRLSTGI